MRDLLLAAAGLCLSTAVALAFVTLAPVSLHDKKHRQIITMPTFVQRLRVADLLICIPLYIVLASFALYGTYELAQIGTVDARWAQQTKSTYWFQVLYVMRMLTHLPIQWVSLKDTPTMRLQMTLHHLLSAACFGGGLLTGRLHFWATFDGCCEVTTIFLMILETIRSFAPKDAYFAAEAISGLSLWLSFVIFRIVLFPVWLYVFYSDVYTHPEQTWDTAFWVEKWCYPAVTLFLLVLSCMWMVPLTKGCLKALGLAGKSKDR